MALTAETQAAVAPAESEVLAQDGTVVICAWCQQFGRPQAAARPQHSRDWYPVSHEYARARAAGGRASHGLCPACLPAVARDWGLEQLSLAPANSGSAYSLALPPTGPAPRSPATREGGTRPKRIRLAAVRSTGRSRGRTESARGGALSV